MGRAYVAGPDGGATFLSGVLQGEPCDGPPMGAKGLGCLACYLEEEDGYWSARQRRRDAGGCQPACGGL